jgi:lysophospholipase L1-like esterase
MGALGDSMTAAAIANLRRQDAVWPWFQAYFAGQGLAFGGLFAAAGIDRAMTVVDRRHLSWATGIDPQDRVLSHGGRLDYLSGGKIRLENFAISGAHAGPREGDNTNMIEVQMPRLLEWSRENLGQAAPDYVVVLIGANDVCEHSVEEMTPVNVYQQRVSDAVDTLLERSPNTRILLSSLPNIETLRGVAKDARLMPPYFNKCEDLWKTAYKRCSTLTLETDPYQRARVAQRVTDFNGVLRDLAETRAAKYGDRIRYAPKTFDVVFDPNVLAVDCFHPNDIGQDMIAAATWESSWWADEWKQREGQYLKDKAAKKAREAKEARRNACRARQAANPTGPQGGC